MASSSKSKPEAAAPPDDTDEVSGTAMEPTEDQAAAQAPDRPWTPEELTHHDPVTGRWAPALKEHWPELQPGYESPVEPALEEVNGDA